MTSTLLPQGAEKGNRRCLQKLPKTYLLLTLGNTQIQIHFYSTRGTSRLQPRNTVLSGVVCGLSSPSHCTKGYAASWPPESSIATAKSPHSLGDVPSFCRKPASELLPALGPSPVRGGAEKEGEDSSLVYLNPKNVDFRGGDNSNGLSACLLVGLVTQSCMALATP